MDHLVIYGLGYVHHYHPTILLLLFITSYHLLLVKHFDFVVEEMCRYGIINELTRGRGERGRMGPRGKRDGGEKLNFPITFRLVF